MATPQRKPGFTDPLASVGISKLTSNRLAALTRSPIHDVLERNRKMFEPSKIMRMPGLEAALRPMPGIELALRSTSAVRHMGAIERMNRDAARNLGSMYRAPTPHLSAIFATSRLMDSLLPAATAASFARMGNQTASTLAGMDSILKPSALAGITGKAFAAEALLANRHAIGEVIDVLSRDADAAQDMWDELTELTTVIEGATDDSSEDLSTTLARAQLAFVAAAFVGMIQLMAVMKDQTLSRMRGWSPGPLPSR